MQVNASQIHIHFKLNISLIFLSLPDVKEPFLFKQIKMIRITLHVFGSGVIQTVSLFLCDLTYCAIKFKDHCYSLKRDVFIFLTCFYQCPLDCPWVSRPNAPTCIYPRHPLATHWATLPRAYITQSPPVTTATSRLPMAWWQVSDELTLNKQLPHLGNLKNNHWRLSSLPGY